MKRIIILISALLSLNSYGACYSPMLFPTLGALSGESGLVQIDTGLVAGSPDPTISYNGTTYHGTPVYESYTDPGSGAVYQAYHSVFAFDSVALGSGISYAVTGQRSVVILSRSDISLMSSLSIGTAGASHYGDGYPGSDIFGSGGGAAYGGQGTAGWIDGGWGYPTQIAQPYGDPTLKNVLLGGSTGGNYGGHWGWPENVGGGVAGGAVELVAEGAISLNGSLSVAGGAGQTEWIYMGTFYPGGGGSGGGMLLCASTVNLGDQAVLDARGGATEDGMHGGSGGRVAIYADTINGLSAGKVKVNGQSWAANGTFVTGEAVPEPATCLLLGLGAILLGVGSRFAKGSQC